MNVEETMRGILEAESAAIKNIPVTSEYAAAVDLIMEKVHRGGGKLVCAGMGKCSHVAMNIAATFASTGTPAINIHPSDAQHGDLGMLQPSDVMLLISNSGETVEMIELVELAHQLYPQMSFISITGKKECTLASLADVRLWTGETQEVCPFGLAPTTSVTVMSVMGDVLVVNMMKASGFTLQEYAKRHYGGNIGDTIRRRR